MNLWVRAVICLWRWNTQAVKRGRLALYLSLHSCAWWVCVCVCIHLSDACPRVTSPVLHRWVSIELDLLKGGDTDKKKWVWQTDSAEWVKERARADDKCIKNESVPLCPLCPLCRCGSCGVTVNLAGTIKDTSFKGKGIHDDLLEGKVKPETEPGISERLVKVLTRCKCTNIQGTVQFQNPKKATNITWTHVCGQHGITCEFCFSCMWFYPVMKTPQPVGGQAGVWTGRTFRC